MWTDSHGQMPLESAFWFSVRNKLEAGTVIEVVDARGRTRHYEVGITCRQIKPKGVVGR